MESKQVFIRLINQHVRIAHKICALYANGVDEKKDLLQEMMYQLWKSFPQFGGQSKFSTWMYRVCLNTALTYRRKENRYKNEPLSDNHNDIPEEIQKGHQDEVNELLFAIGKLSPLNKAIILLYLEDLTYQEISEITGLTKSNVSVRLVRIKKELELILKPVIAK